MVYWKDIPTDALFVSPLLANNNDKQEQKYVTFEPDEGRWNNARMSLEAILTMAHAMGRTLVLVSFFCGRDGSRG